MIYLTTKEVAELYGKAHRTIRWRVKEGKLPVIYEKTYKSKKTALIPLTELPPEIQKRYVERLRKDEEKYINVESSYFDDEFGRKFDIVQKSLYAGLKEIKKIAEEEGISWQTIYRWRSQYLKSGKNPMSLCRVRFKKNHYAFSKEAIKFAVSVYLSQSKPDVRFVYNLLKKEADEKGWKIGSYIQLCRIIKEIPEPVKVYARDGEEIFRKMFLPRARRDYSMLGCNEVWVADHTQLNLLCIYQGRIIRPWITVFQDLASKAIVGFCLSERPSSDTIAAAFRHAVLPKKPYQWEPVNEIFREDRYIKERLDEMFYWPQHGVPKCIYIDNGKDFKSKRFWNLKGGWDPKEEYLGRIDFENPDAFKGVGTTPVGAMDILGIEKQVAMPYTPWAKPVEAWFKVLKRYLQFFPGAWRNADNIRQRDRKRIERYIKQGKLLSFEEVRGLIEFYIVFVWNAKPHGDERRKGKKGKSPNQIWLEKAEREGIKTVSERALDFALMKAQERVVQKNGIQMFGEWYESEDLYMYMGRKIEVRYDPADISRVYCFWEGKFIAEARCKAYLAQRISEKTLEMHRRKQRKFMKEIKKEILGEKKKRIPDPLRIIEIEMGEIKRGKVENIKRLETRFKDVRREEEMEQIESTDSIQEFLKKMYEQAGGDDEGN
jgi:transposase InsO family protein